MSFLVDQIAHNNFYCGIQTDVYFCSIWNRIILKYCELWWFSTFQNVWSIFSKLLTHLIVYRNFMRMLKIFWLFFSHYLPMCSRVKYKRLSIWIYIINSMTIIWQMIKLITMTIVSSIHSYDVECLRKYCIYLYIYSCNIYKFVQ